MRSKTLCLALAAAAAAAGTVAPLATAKTKTIPKAELIERGDAICTKGNSRITLAPPSADPDHVTAEQLRAAAPFLRQIATVIGSEVRQVDALGKPDADRGLFTRAIAKAHTMVKWMRREAKAAEAGDVEAFHRASRHDSGEAAGQLLGRFGFQVCGQ